MTQNQRLPLEGWRAFISYPNADLDVAQLMAQLVEQNGAHARYWERDRKPGAKLWDSIRGWIAWSNCVVGVVTRRALQDASLTVGQELGVAVAQNKLVIPILENEVPRDLLGMVQDRVTITLDPKKPWGAFGQLGDALIRETEEFNERLRRGALVLGGILLFAAITGQGK